MWGKQERCCGFGGAWSTGGGPGRDGARSSAQGVPETRIPTPPGWLTSPQRLGQATLLELAWCWLGELRRVSEGPPRNRSRPGLLHLHLPHILVPLALHAPQLGHALLQVGGSVAVLNLVVLAAVLGWGGERRETPTSKARDAWPMGQSADRGRAAQLGTCITWGQAMARALNGPVCPVGTGL